MSPLVKKAKVLGNKFNNKYHIYASPDPYLGNAIRKKALGYVLLTRKKPQKPRFLCMAEMEVGMAFSKVRER
jgi:hypothetical protein